MVNRHKENRENRIKAHVLASTGSIKGGWITWVADLLGFENKDPEPTLIEKALQVQGLDRKGVQNDSAKALRAISKANEKYVDAMGRMGEADRLLEETETILKGLPEIAPSLFTSRKFSNYYKKHIEPMLDQLLPDVNAVYNVIDDLDEKMESLYVAVREGDKQITQVLKKGKAVDGFENINAGKDIFRNTEHTGSSEDILDEIFEESAYEEDTFDDLSDEGYGDIQEFIIPSMERVLIDLGFDDVQFEGASENRALLYDEDSQKITCSFSFAIPGNDESSFSEDTVSDLISDILDELEVDGHIDPEIETFEFLASQMNNEVLLTISVYEG